MASFKFSIKENSDYGAVIALSTDKVVIQTWSVISTTTPRKVYAELLVDDLTDLPAKDAYTGYVLCVGSLATIVSKGSTYRLDSEGRWRNQKTGVPASGDILYPTAE